MKKKIIEVAVKVIVAALLPDGDYDHELHGIRTDCALGSAANHRGQARTDRSKMLSLVPVPMIHMERAMDSGEDLSLFIY